MEQEEASSSENPKPSGFSGFVKRIVQGFHGVADKVDNAVNKSTFGRIFRLRGCGHPDEIPRARFMVELRAGLTTFATMAYIIAVNAEILKDTGGTCVCINPQGHGRICDNETEYVKCVNELKRDLITATAAISGLATILFGFFTNLPVALAPGMGLNAYFTYQVVGYRGGGPVSYQQALTAIFVEGFVFIALALTGMRQWLVKLIPNTLKIASAVGIGLFLTLIGMSSHGIGIVSGNVETPMALAGCPDSSLDPTTNTCKFDQMRDPKMWVGICFGGVLTAILMSFKVRTSILIGILIVSIVSWPRDTDVTYFPHTEEGDDRFEFFKKVVTFHPIEHILAVQQWGGSGSSTHFALAFFTFLYVDIIDCTATLYSMARFCRPNETRDGTFPRSTIAYCTDAACITIGSLLGTSPVTAFVESGAGISQGGVTGLTAVVTGTCFILSLFFAPIIASIPPWATGCALILVGCLMARQVDRINWKYWGDALPSFVTIAFIPMSYSVAYGLIAGLFSYVAINVPGWLIMKATNGRLTPQSYGEKQIWDPRAGLPGWVRACKNLWGAASAAMSRSESVIELQAREGAGGGSGGGGGVLRGPGGGGGGGDGGYASDGPLRGGSPTSSRPSRRGTAGPADTAVYPLPPPASASTIAAREPHVPRSFH